MRKGSGYIYICSRFGRDYDLSLSTSQLQAGEYTLYLKSWSPQSTINL
jgi:hypothetical protein